MNDPVQVPVGASVTDLAIIIGLLLVFLGWIIPSFAKEPRYQLYTPSWWMISVGFLMFVIGVITILLRY